MSRGLGKTQRAILKILEERKEWMQLEDLKISVYPERANLWGAKDWEENKMASKDETVSRALRSLEHRGMIKSKIVSGCFCKARGWRKFVRLC